MKLSYCEGFRLMFPDSAACYQYLCQIKNKTPYACRRCGHGFFSKGRTRYHRRCKSCGYDESPLTGTLFSGSHLPVYKAFYLLYKVQWQNKPASSRQLALWLGLQPKTVQRFRKRMLAYRECLICPGLPTVAGILAFEEKGEG